MCRCHARAAAGSSEPRRGGFCPLPEPGQIGWSPQRREDAAAQGESLAWPEPSGPGESLEVSACVCAFLCYRICATVHACVCGVFVAGQRAYMRGAACSRVCVHRRGSVMAWGDVHMCGSACARATCAGVCVLVHACAQAGTRTHLLLLPARTSVHVGHSSTLRRTSTFVPCTLSRVRACTCVHVCMIKCAVCARASRGLAVGTGGRPGWASPGPSWASPEGPCVGPHGTETFTFTGSAIRRPT